MTPKQQDPWRKAIDDARMAAGLDCLGDDSDPRDALRGLIAQEVRIALDPAVSSDAQARDGQAMGLYDQPAPKDQAAASSGGSAPSSGDSAASSGGSTAAPDEREAFDRYRRASLGPLCTDAEEHLALSAFKAGRASLSTPAAPVVPEPLTHFNPAPHASPALVPTPSVTVQVGATSIDALSELAKHPRWQLDCEVLKFGAPGKWRVWTLKGRRSSYNTEVKVLGEGATPLDAIRAALAATPAPTKEAP